jgi:hypothetical protein
MTTETNRWILAFDASCGMSEDPHVVEQACDGKLEVLSLSRSEVRTWREQALGQPAPWEPTLIKQHGNLCVPGPAAGWVTDLIAGWNVLALSFSTTGMNPVPGGVCGHRGWLAKGGRNGSGWNGDRPAGRTALGVGPCGGAIREVRAGVGPGWWGRWRP